MQSSKKFIVLGVVVLIVVIISILMSKNESEIIENVQSEPDVQLVESVVNEMFHIFYGGLFLILTLLMLVLIFILH